MMTSTAIRFMAPENVHEAILPLGHEFEKAINSPLVRIVDDIFVKNWQQYIAMGIGIVIAAYDVEVPVGILSAFAVPDHLNGELRCQESWFYVKPEYRNGIGSMLLRALEDESRRRGVQYMCLGMLHHLDPAVAQFYTKHGYTPFETWSFKALA